MLSEYSAPTFQLLQDHSKFVENPDIVEDYFDLVRFPFLLPYHYSAGNSNAYLLIRLCTLNNIKVTEYLKTCPLNTLAFLDSIFQCGLAGLTFNHREAVEAILDFFYFLLSIISSFLFFSFLFFSFLFFFFTHAIPTLLIAVTAPGKECEEKMLPLVRNQLNQFGGHLVYSLFQGVAGSFPRRCVDLIAKILREMLHLSTDVLFSKKGRKWQR